MRKPISKQLRFEVFKRDSFKCQYCGEAAPDVILHIDHIKPVVMGGDNDLTNLITACIGCNLGKGARELDDNSILAKQRAQLQELNERREQLEMMLEWREALKEFDSEQLDAICDYYSNLLSITITETHRGEFKKLLKKHSTAEVLQGIDASANSYLVPEGDWYTQESMSKTFSYIGRICNVNKNGGLSADKKQVFYIRGILKNRFSTWYKTLEHQTIEWIEGAVNQGLELDDVQNIAKRSKNWTHFRTLINEAIEEL